MESITQYYRLSIYRSYQYVITNTVMTYCGYVWYDSAERIKITMIKLRSCLHSRTTPHTPPLRARYGVSFVSYTKKNHRDILRVHYIPAKLVNMPLLHFTPHGYIPMLVWNHPSSNGHQSLIAYALEILQTCTKPSIWTAACNVHTCKPMLLNELQLTLIVNSSPSSASCMRQWTGSALVQIMDCRLFGTKLLSKPVLRHCQLGL